MKNDTTKTTNDTASAYWAVRYAGGVRVTSYKVSTAVNACKATFGLVAHDMAVKRLTTRKSELQRSTRFLDNALAELEGWRLLTEEELPNDLERGARRRSRTTLNDKGWPERHDDERCRLCSHAAHGDAPCTDRGQNNELPVCGCKRLPAPVQPPAKQPPAEPARAKVVGCSFKDCGANVIKLERTDDVPVYLNITFPLSLHTCGVKPEGVELIMLPAYLAGLIHDHTQLNKLEREPACAPMFALGLADYEVVAAEVRALIVGEGVRSAEAAPLRNAPACRPSPESLALELARELVKQEEEGTRVNSVCECKGSALGVENVKRHKRGEKDPCLYAMAVDVLVQAGEREK